MNCFFCNQNSKSNLYIRYCNGDNSKLLFPVYVCPSCFTTRIEYKGGYFERIINNNYNDNDNIIRLNALSKLPVKSR